MHYPTTTYDSYGAQQLPSEEENHAEEKQEVVDYYGETIYPDDFVFVYYFFDQKVETENTLLVSYRKYVVRDENSGKLITEKGFKNLDDSRFESYRGKDWLAL